MSSITVARAPGRLDVMGGIADYSGSLVLQKTITETTEVALQRIDEPILDIVSDNSRSFSLPLSALTIEYAEARNIFKDPRAHWASYVAGIFIVLVRERGVEFSKGARLRISSTVPESKGLASSAALEVAVMRAVAEAYGLGISPYDMALLCQKAENLVAGAPCGVMDQMAAACGEPNTLLALRCQPAELLPPVPIPEGIAFWGLDSGERHAVSGSDYTSVRTAAFMGARIIGLGPGDYLANISPQEFTERWLPQLPEQMSGAEFIARYSKTFDAVTTVDPARTYAVRQATAHPVFENFRVHEFRRLLMSKLDSATLEKLGELMYESHASYVACGLGSPGTDLLVRQVREGGPKNGLYGARITGGGSGGTVAVLGDANASSRRRRS